MRKDVKLSLAIGAVLLAVVIVWAAVPRHSKKQVVVVPANVDTSTPQTPPAQPGEVSPPESTDMSHTGTPTPAQPSDSGTAIPGNAAAKDSTDSGKSASTDWAALLKADDIQLKTMMAQPHGTATPAVDHPDLSASAGNTSTDSDTQTTSDHTQGGMTFDAATATTRPTATVSIGSRTHTVQTGETLASIAKSVYGRSGMYLAIEKANPSINPNRLKVGAVLNLPSSNSAASGSTDSSDALPGHHRTSAESTLDSTKEYRVQPGDNLHKISVRLYGNAGRADELYTSNKEVIGDNPAKLKVGEVLKLPEPPAGKTTAAIND